jgi:dTDP-4-dehydrorhamnose reductase
VTGIALLVPGGHGQLGRELSAMAPPDAVVTAPGSSELDVTEPRVVLEAVTTLVAQANAQDLRPIVINAAAYTSVDAAETEARRAFAVNADAPRVLAAVCSSRGVPMVHVSTDYVFPGDADRPYETDDEPGPKSMYGATKLAGEEAVLRSGVRGWVVRTSWVYGASGHNFVKTMARLEKSRDSVSVVDDQRGTPTLARDLAGGLLELAGRIVGGTPPAHRVLHCVGGGETTWFSFARAIFEELGADPARVRPLTTAEYPTPAARPAYSVLSTKAWEESGLTPLPPWREALSRAFEECGDEFRGVTPA